MSTQTLDPNNTIPYASDPVEHERQIEQRRRRRMLTGCWALDAEGRLAGFYNDTVIEFMPDAEISRNPALEAITQVATVYDEPATIAAEGVDPDALPDLIPTGFWAVAQDRLNHQIGIMDALVRVDILEPDPFGAPMPRSPMTVRRVDADLVEIIPHPKRPARAAGVIEYRIHDVDGVPTWTREVWDLREGGSFRVETFAVEEKGKPTTEAVDVTAQVFPELMGAYPYLDGQGHPVLPYALYHVRGGASQVWHWTLGAEAFSGTLTTAALWTEWLMGVRDGASPLRALIDGDVENVATTKGPTGARVVAAGRMSVLQIKSKTDRGASLLQLPPTMDPASTGEAIEAFQAGVGLALLGLQPGDIKRGTSAESGYAIVVRNSGKQRVRKRLEVPCLEGDRALLATMARMHNGRFGTAWPEDEEAWTVEYSALNRAPEEIKAEDEHIAALRAEGTLGRVGAYLIRHPSASPQEAIEALAEQAMMEAALAARIEELTGVAESAAPPTPAEEANPAEQNDE